MQDQNMGQELLKQTLGSNHFLTGPHSAFHSDMNIENVARLCPKMCFLPQMLTIYWGEMTG